MKTSRKTTVCQLLLWLTLLFFVFSLFIETTPPAVAGSFSSPVELQEGWQYHWGQSNLAEKGSWREWDLHKGHVAKKPGYQFLWLKIKLPSGPWQNPVIYLYGVLANSLDVYLDGQKIYYSQEVDNVLGNQGLRKIVVPLQGDWEGKTLYLRLESGPNHYLGLYGTILLGYNKDILERIVKCEFDHAVLGFFFLIFTLVILAVYLLVKAKSYKKALLALLFFTLCTGIWNITEYDNIDLILFYSPLWVYLDAIAILFSPVAGLYFYEHVFGCGPKNIIRRLWQLHLLYALPYLVLITVDLNISNPYTYKILSIIYSWSVFRVLFFLDSLIILATIFITNYKGSSVETKIFTWGIAILSFSLIYKDLSLVNWGIFCCIFSFILILGYRFVLVHENLEQLVADKTEELRILLADLEAQNQAFAYQITIDSLTKIYNKLKFNQSLEAEIAKVREINSKLSIITFDIDYFKKINDTFGHLAGDHVLVNLAKIVTENLADKYVFARWGGEEFAILAPGDDWKTAYELAEKLRVVIASYPFDEVDQITCSFGVTEFLEQDTPNSLIKRVDDAMYLAKDTGRNQVKVLLE